MKKEITKNDVNNNQEEGQIIITVKTINGEKRIDMNIKGIPPESAYVLLDTIKLKLVNVNMIAAQMGSEEKPSYKG